MLVAQIILHVEEIAPVVEELRDEELGAGFDLLGGEIPIVVLAAGLDVPFGIAGGADADFGCGRG